MWIWIWAASLFEMVKGFEGSLECIRHDYDNSPFVPSGDYLVVEGTSHLKCLKNLGLEAKPPADVSATCLSFEMAEYLAWTFISISTIQERIEHGFDGARIVTGDILNPHCFGSRTRPLRGRVRRTTEGTPDHGKKLIVGAACSLVSRPVIKELLDSGLETTSRSRSSQNPWGS
jgi:hypothetical protein